MKRFKKVAIVFAEAAFIVIGILLLWFTYAMTKTMLDGANWVSAPATITYTYTTRPTAGRTTASFTPIYVPHPTYSFIANDGKTYSGNRYGFLDSTGMPVPTENIDQPKVIEGEIFYDPENPNNNAVQQPKFEPIYTFTFLLFAVLSVAAGVALIHSRLGIDTR